MPKAGEPSINTNVTPRVPNAYTFPYEYKEVGGPRGSVRGQFLRFSCLFGMCSRKPRAGVFAHPSQHAFHGGQSDPAMLCTTMCVQGGRGATRIAANFGAFRVCLGLACAGRLAESRGPECSRTHLNTASSPHLHRGHSDPAIRYTTMCVQ